MKTVVFLIVAKDRQGRARDPEKAVGQRFYMEQDQADQALAKMYVSSELAAGAYAVVPATLQIPASIPWKQLTPALLASLQDKPGTLYYLNVPSLGTLLCGYLACAPGKAPWFEADGVKIPADQVSHIRASRPGSDPVRQ